MIGKNNSMGKLMVNILNEVPSSAITGVDGVAGTLDAFRRSEPTLLIVGSSRRVGVESSRISRSTRPLYLNLVPNENILPPVTTCGASELDGKLWRKVNSL